ncbi:MAG: pyruvate kinase, partial [Thermoplasmataceae archaeon]
INHPSILGSLKPGDTIFMSDGKVSLTVINSSKDQATVSAGDNAVIRDRSRINIPGRVLDLGTITDRDREFLKEGVAGHVDYFALSFVQSKANVQSLQKAIMDIGGSQGVVAKIETKSGYQNIGEIAMASDVVMVARGDLGVELPLTEVSLAQKNIIYQSHRRGKPTIVATQMLESMVMSDSPTRAEVSDVTNAILDNADSLMLSEETAMGKYPVQTIEYLSRISEYVESQRMDFPEPEEFIGNKVAYSIAVASKTISEDSNAEGIIAFTRTGNTARMISAVRPRVPAYGVVNSESTARKLNLYRGIIPVFLPINDGETTDVYDMTRKFQELNGIRRGLRYVVTSGAPYFLFGGTNDVRVITTGRYLGVGHANGISADGTVTYGTDGNCNILVVSKEDEIPLNASKYDGIICQSAVSSFLRERLRESETSLLSNAKLFYDIKEGDNVFIDGYTGIVVS